MNAILAHKSRRGILTAGATLSAAGALALMDLPARAAGKAAAGGNTAQDVQLLNAALALEDEGIAAYQIGAESKLLTPDVLKVAVTFQGHHKTHRDDLIAAIKRLGGKPVEPKKLGDYAKELNAASLKDQTGVLRLALKLETGATNAYLGIIPSLGESDLYLLAARTAGDEAFHAGVLGHVLGVPVPQKAPLFG
ncbi:MAG: ferritin-like domain-containing protein [Alphaproteobacteria bacterium]|nr:ferritin-like domain-containing protein [Alphaproteobacteria bacterium]MBN9558909.1 ferritin-like domain-containing protein [Alphaproteobacteria bacterium]MBN9579059.1 ferritin-like domain-containing protein [Alphaproteobacteria bacterium]MBN9592792.1 ferritin-like domain-containing protein [Alphaproteobacteria bacterium]